MHRDISWSLFCFTLAAHARGLVLFARLHLLLAWSWLGSKAPGSALTPHAFHNWLQHQWRVADAHWHLNLMLLREVTVAFETEHFKRPAFLQTNIFRLLEPRTGDKGHPLCLG